MNWLYIVGGVILFFCILLFSNVCIRIGFKDNDFFVTLRYLFYRKQILPEKEKTQRQLLRDEAKKQKREAKKEKKEQKNQPDPQEKVKSEKGGLSFDAVISLIGEIGRILRDLLHKIRIKPCKLHISVATGDAATTAINYGRICAGLSMFEAVMKNTFGEFKSDFSAECDYLGEKMRVEADIKILLRPSALLGLGAKAVVRMLKSPDDGFGPLLKK